jgi:Fe-S cluster assembly scaffold protein SufB
MNKLEELQKVVKEKMISLDYPTRKYGQGMVMNYNIDFDDVFSNVIEVDINDVKVSNSSKDVIVTSYKKLVDNGDEQIVQDVNNYLNKAVECEFGYDKIKLGLISKAKDFMVVHVKEGVSVDKPMLLDTFFDKKNIFSKVVVVAKENSSVTIIDNVESGRRCEFASRNVHVVCGRGAHVNVVGVNNFDKGSQVIINKTSQVESEGLVTFNDFLAGGKYVRLDIKSYLIGVGANSKINNAIVNNNSLHDIKNDVIHNESNTHANIKSKSVIVNGRSVFRGTINIPFNSKDCVSHQIVNNLLVGEDAKSDAVPILDASNDDVSCSHGATISEIEEEDIYYLNSRGISSDDAKKIIIKGFVQSIIDEFDLDQFDGLNNRINEKIFGVVRKNV